MAGGGSEDQRGHGKTHRRRIWTHWVLTGMMREILPTTVPDGDNSSPNVLIRTGRTKSKYVSFPVCLVVRPVWFLVVPMLPVSLRVVIDNSSVMWCLSGGGSCLLSSCLRLFHLPTPHRHVHIRRCHRHILRPSAGCKQLRPQPAGQSEDGRTIEAHLTL